MITKFDVSCSPSFLSALAVGSLVITYVGGKVSRHFATSGDTVNEVNKAEKHCEKGTIVLAQSAWRYCPEKKGINAERLDDKHVKVGKQNIIHNYNTSFLLVDFMSCDWFKVGHMT